LHLTILPLLAQAAIRQKRARGYWLWTVLRALDREGKGWVDLEAAKGAWRQSDRSLLRTLSAGEGNYWRSVPGRVFLKSTFKVGCYLESALGVPSKVDFELCCSIGKFRAQCLAAWFWKERTISVATLAELYGVSVSTIQTWTRKAGLGKQANIARYEPPKDSTGMPNHTFGGVWFSGGYCYFQIPNSYYNRDTRRCARHLRTERKLRNALNLDLGQCAKLYFDKDGDACRALQAGQKRAWVKTRGERHDKKIWCYYAMP